MQFNGLPCVIGWELTVRCNLRCRHCASSAGQPRADELTTEEALDLCDQLPWLAVQEVDLTGGEPLLREDWPVIADRLRELSIQTRLVTNGLLLEECVERLKDVGVCTVAVSLDGLAPTHDEVRGRAGLFDRVLRGIERALSADLPVAVITAVSGLNASQLERMLALLLDVGVTHWQVQPIIPRGRALSGGDLPLTEQAYMEFGRFVVDHAAHAKTRGFAIRPADGLGYYTEMDTRHQPWTGCAAGLAACGITSDGHVKGCLSMPDTLTEGNVRHRDLWDIWFDDESFAYNRRFSPEDLGEFCAGCEMGEQCMGGCSVMSYASTGQFHNDPYCFTRILRHRECSQLGADPSCSHAERAVPGRI